MTGVIAYSEHGWRRGAWIGAISSGLGIEHNTQLTLISASV